MYWRQRYQTDELCPESGSYQFDGYVEGRRAKMFEPNEIEIELDEGTTFPAVGETDQDCYWIPAGGSDEALLHEAYPFAGISY